MLSDPQFRTTFLLSAAIALAILMALCLLVFRSRQASTIFVWYVVIGLVILILGMPTSQTGLPWIAARSGTLLVWNVGLVILPLCAWIARRQ